MGSVTTYTCDFCSVSLDNKHAGDERKIDWTYVFGRQITCCRDCWTRGIQAMQASNAIGEDSEVDTLKQELKEREGFIAAQREEMRKLRVDLIETEYARKTSALTVERLNDEVETLKSQIDRRDRQISELKTALIDREQTHSAKNLENLALKDQVDVLQEDNDGLIYQQCQNEQARDAELEAAYQSAAINVKAADEHRKAFEAIRVVMLNTIADVLPIALRVKKKHTTKEERRKLRALAEMLAKVRTSTKETAHANHG